MYETFSKTHIPDIDFAAYPVISVVGAGGKTTLIHLLADKFMLESGRPDIGNSPASVLITTTTHMYIEQGADLSCDRDLICGKLRQGGIVMAGSPCISEPRKLGRLPSDVFRVAAAHAGLTLIEADGAKHFPAKYPAENEPVIIPETNLIIIVMGLKSIGKKIKDAVFRYELMLAEFSEAGIYISPETIVDCELLIKIIEYGYIRKLTEEFPKATILPLFSNIEL
ncbi:MAG: selenium cofactor biosynthesis protein YqeC [Eubacteriales bacterium]|nr:selenium cofactor biosynthesis protein YqeC [Eubacteriales bacterium]